jgi:hypothetical protein
MIWGCFNVIDCMAYQTIQMVICDLCQGYFGKSNVLIKSGFTITNWNPIVKKIGKQVFMLFLSGLEIIAIYYIIKTTNNEGPRLIKDCTTETNASD